MEEQRLHFHSTGDSVDAKLHFYLGADGDEAPLHFYLTEKETEY